MSEKPEVEALAEVWASIDGRLESFQRERELKEPLGNLLDDPTFMGHYVGYIAEAEEMIRRLNDRGFTITPLSCLALGGDGK